VKVIYSFSFYCSPSGIGAAVASESGVVEVMLPYGGLSDSALAAGISGRYPAAIEDVGFAVVAARELQAYFSGEHIEFSVPKDISRLSAFARHVSNYVATIGYGQVRTYGEVAGAVGMTGAARGVGAVMAANRLPVIIPCHRVVAADGSMKGYSAAGGIGTKLQLLKMEGVNLSSLGRVVRSQ
jgi:methylated-DNA-[protein]-cysteine S-methyltransferase